ncbi:hypothetical protein ACVPOS_15590 [Staphylococcus aureus]
MLERENTLESRSRLENIDEFMSVPKDYEENTPLEEQSLINFLTDLSLVADIDEADTEMAQHLMTMHCGLRALNFQSSLYGDGRIFIPTY